MFHVIWLIFIGLPFIDTDSNGYELAKACLIILTVEVPRGVLYDGSESSSFSTAHPSGSCAQGLRLAFGGSLLWLAIPGAGIDRPSNACPTSSASGHPAAQYP